MKIFIAFALVLFCGLAHGINVPDSSVQDNYLEDTAITEKTETSKIKIGIGIMITGILLFILVLIGCPKANNFRIPQLQHVPETPEDTIPGCSTLDSSTITTSLPNTIQQV